jgi:predicted ATPase/transcriptional regulator with XRE-family HTH domain
MADTASFGYWVRRWRKACDLTQKQLAEKVPCAVVTINKIEIDERRPSRQMAERLASCLNIPEAQRSNFIQVAIREKPVYTLYLPERPIATSPDSLVVSKVPAPLTRLIGRRVEVEAIKDCVRRADVRLVTLSGLGGVGKTRLATQVAQELISDFKDGVFFISLAPLTDPELLPIAIAKSIEAFQMQGEAVKESLTRHLANKTTLLVLDNFEHLLPAGLFVSELLKSTSALKILSTSRTPLHLYGERRFIIQPFDLPDQGDGFSELEQNDAVALFVERVQATQYDFKLTTNNAAPIARICQRLDGLPLAIELAAARMNALSPRALLKHLETRLPLLIDGPRDVPLRQQTLTDTVAWSYELLSQTERTLLERLSVFRGGGTLDAIESICSEMEVSITIKGLAALVDQSLVGRHDINNRPRYTMLETIREFAAMRLKSKGAGGAIQRRHLAYYLELAQRAEPELTGKDELIWLDRLEIELDNLRAALDFGLREDASPEIKESAAMLAGTLWYFWYSRGLSQEGGEWCMRALAFTAVENEARAKVLAGTGSLLWAQDYNEEAHSYLDEAISLFRRYNDLSKLAETLHISGHVEHGRQDYVIAKKRFAESLALYQKLEDEANYFTLIKDLGLMAYIQGEYEMAKSYYEESLEWFRSNGMKDGIGSAMRWLGDLERVSGSYEQAASDYREALQYNSEVNLPLAVAATLSRLGQIALHEEEVDEAQSLFLDALKMGYEGGNRYGNVECLVGLGGVAVLKKEPEQAAKLFGVAQALLESMDLPLLPADRLDWERDEKRLRAQLSQDVLESAWQDGKKSPLEQVLDGLMS